MKKVDRIIFDARVSERKILCMPTASIVATPYNPAARTKDGVKLRALAESIKRYGVVQPLTITAERDLVDGNRRLAAAKLAGVAEVECIVLPDGVNQHEVFRDVNSMSEKITGKGWLEACRHGFQQPPAAVMAQYQELFSLIGTYGIDMLIEKKLGLNILALCKSVRALGLPIRLDALIFKVAEGRLTNKINAIYRGADESADKVRQIMALLAKEAA